MVTEALAARLSTRPVAPRGEAPRVDARRVLLIGLVVTGVALAVSLIGLVVDPRVVEGAPAWLKPAKFGVSILIYLATLRWMAGLIGPRVRGLRTASAIVVLAFVLELVAIDLQVVRGTTSHFNRATVFDAAVFSAMGAIISLAFGATCVAALLALRSRGLDASAAAGIRWGLGLALLGMVVPAFMIMNTQWHEGGGHTVGAPDGGPGLALTGWSLAHGDLRIGHFVGLHGLQALPLVAWALARCTPPAARTRLLAVAALGWAGLVVLTTWQALRGQALLHPDVLTLAGAAALLGAVGAATLLVLRAAGRVPAQGISGRSTPGPARG